MATEFWAKSNPPETLQQHTDKLLENYGLLKRLYPNQQVEWQLLYLACLVHDFGKMNRFFQDRLNGRGKDQREIHHGILSLMFIDFEGMADAQENSYPIGALKALAQAVAYHHDRTLDYDEDNLVSETEKLGEAFDRFNYQVLKDLPAGFIKRPSLVDEDFYYQNERIYPTNKRDFKTYVLLKGLLNRIDYAASAHIAVEIENDFLLDCLDNQLMARFRKTNPKASWNHLQQFMRSHQQQNVVVVAETGMGKTEAGLLWIGNHKGFFTLPLKNAINAVYYRVRDQVISLRDEGSPSAVDYPANQPVEQQMGNQRKSQMDWQADYQMKIGVLHSGMRQLYYEDEERQQLTAEGLSYDDYYQRTRQWSLPLTICTIDQLFNFVFLYPGFEAKLATLSYSKVVIDEVQMYAPELLAYLILGIEWMSRFGGRFAVMTATLPPIFSQLLKNRGIDFLMPDPFYMERPVRHKLKVHPINISAQFIADRYDNNKVLVVCNTVGQAQRLYQELREIMKLESNEPSVDLLHSYFVQADRSAKEQAILAFAQRDNQRPGIWVATQVVEASLDIDFDMLITELSDLNGLFQRLGRCNRQAKRRVTDYNCHVFIGNQQRTPTGIGTVIDRDIFELSRQKIEGVDGFIEEPTKVAWVNQLYTLQQLEGTVYYRRLENTLKYTETIEAYYLKKKEAIKQFRNILSQKMIPEPVYKKYQGLIDSYIEILSQKKQPDQSNKVKEQIRRQKMEARFGLERLMVSIPVYYYDKEPTLIRVINVTAYEKVLIFNCHYSTEKGVERLAKAETNFFI